MTYPVCTIVLAGQEAGEPQHCMMGAYVLMEGQLVGGRCVWQREGAGLEAYIHYAGSRGHWYVGSSKANMESGTAAGCIYVASAAMTPDAATEQWRVFVGGAFQDAPQITASTCTEDERQAMAQRAEQEAVAMAQQARIVVLAGQEAGEPQHCLMGVYVLMEGQLVGGRCVWQREGAGLEAYIHYAGSRGHWFVGSSKANMESGVSVGRVCVTSAAMTPDAATEQWRMAVGGALQDAPQITASTCTEHERQAMVRQAEEEAVAKAKEARIIVLAGQEAGQPQHCMMGAYVLMEGQLVGGRCVWQREGAGLGLPEAYIHYVGSRGEWYVGVSKANMELGIAAGYVCVTSAAMTPDVATEQWRVAVGGAFQDAPQITASTCTEDERQAIVQVRRIVNQNQCMSTKWHV
jgi:hypothetical protein